MIYRFGVMVALFVAAAGCGGDDGADTTTGVGEGTAGTTTAAATSTGTTAASTSSADATGATSAGPTSSGSDGSDATESGDPTSSTGSADSTDTTDTTGSAQTPCGARLCDASTEICVERAKGGPSSIGCEPVPRGCEADRTCNCVGVPLCTVGLMSCTDVGDNVVFCDSGLD